MVDEGRKGSGEVMRSDMVGRERGGTGGCCGVLGNGGMNVCVVGRDDGCLLSGGKGVWGGVVLAFFLTRLVSRGLGDF